ncbi:P-loop containing nucleoside triphosphate hydrolase protein [Chiua virens]|nr:P-loop containing nucleoside triphosphate hydrolase protein [Chiua virens]
MSHGKGKTKVCDARNPHKPLIIAAEPDSDPEFNTGAFIYETKKKGERGRAPPGASPLRKSRSKRSDILGDTRYATSARKTSGRVPEPRTNPLLEYFGDDLDLHSASEDEETAEIDDGESAVGSGRDSDTEPVVSRTLTMFLKSQETTPNRGGITPAVNDSVTESESEAEPAMQTLKRKSPSFLQVVPPSKHMRTLPAEDDSETEPESEEDELLKAARFAVQPVSPSRSDSETESESEEDMIANPAFTPRPAFPLREDQKYLGPLVLNREKGIMIPAAINTYLREYQREGVRFFWDLYNQGRGGVLGDDMGLVGKTIQVISFLSAIMKKNGDQRDLNRRRNYVSELQDGVEWRKHRTLPPADTVWPTCLIIAPSTVVGNWEREFEMWGYFEVGSYIGSPAHREEVLTDFRMGRLDVVTSFDLARRDIAVLDELPWSVIIVDEAHRVKNPRSKITLAYHQFACMRRFGLTGTAIQNSYNELWTILDWTNPGKLGSTKQWKGYIVKPLTMGQSAHASEEERTKALAVARILKEHLLPNFFKRRTKEIIKNQLPTKIDEVMFCPLTPQQIKVYKRILAMDQVQNIVRKEEFCDCGSKKKRKECCHPIGKGDVLKFTSVLIKISNHLALILPAPTDTQEQTIKHRELAGIVYAGESVPKFGTAMMQPSFCGKWTVLDILLKDWRKDASNKVLIFTKSVKLLEMLEFHLSNRGYGFLKLDGSISQPERMPLIDKFHLDPDIYIFLISTLAGGTGLNLTGANKVVIFDPAHDLQAMDRAYRFGQTRDVHVYRLLGAGSIEELIYARQLYKQQQMAIGYQASVQTRYFAGVQGDTSRQGELFGAKNIFKLHEDTLATKLAIERASIIELDWALANLGGKSRQRSKAKDDFVQEADQKGGKEEADLRGLTALLFDDDPPEVPEENDIQRTLGAIGVKYSHRNDEVLRTSTIEEERSSNALKEHKRRRAAARKSKEGPGDAEVKTKRPKSPEIEWPPKRKHHKPPPTATEQLASRQRALIELGYIKDPAHVPVFAQSFARKSREEQEEILGKLDEHTRHHP